MFNSEDNFTNQSSQPTTDSKPTDTQSQNDLDNHDDLAAPAVPAAKLLETLAAYSLGPLSQLQSALNLTLDQVSAWIADPANRQQISNLVTLLDAQTQLFLCQQRVIAAARLVNVANEADKHETVRRACSDLLKIRLIDPYKEDARKPRKRRPYDPSFMNVNESHEQLTYEEIQKALEELGEE